MSRQSVVASIVCAASISCMVAMAGDKRGDKRNWAKTIEIYAVLTKDGKAEVQISDDDKLGYQAPRITLNLDDEKHNNKLQVSETGPTTWRASESGGMMRRSKRLVIQLP
jgi:flagellar basal body-associated protein FliL